MLKKKINRNLFLAAACCILAACCFLSGRYLRNSGDGILKNLTIEAEGDGFDSQQVEALFAGKYSSQREEGEENKSTAFAAWTELGNEIVSEGFGGRNADTNVIAVCGPSYCLLPFGKNLAAEDLSGCIVGESLAEKLFGSSQAKGQEISWRDRKWKVRDVVCEPSDFVMVPASGIIGEVSFDRISIIPEEKEDRLLVGESFISQYGIFGHMLRFDYLYRLSWLKEMVPGEWSDFEGWRNNFKKYQKASELVKSAKKSVIESAGLSYRKRASFSFWSGILLYVASGWLVFRPADRFLK